MFRSGLALGDRNADRNISLSFSGNVFGFPIGM